MLARDELDAIESAQRQRPDLILVSLAGLPGEVLGSGRRIRMRTRRSGACGISNVDRTL